MVLDAKNKLMPIYEDVFENINQPAQIIDKIDVQNDYEDPREQN